MKKFVAKIKRKKGCMYFVDKDGIVWEQDLNKGMTKKMIENKKKRAKKKYF